MGIAVWAFIMCVIDLSHGRHHIEFDENDAVRDRFTVLSMAYTGPRSNVIHNIQLFNRIFLYWKL